MQDVSVTIIDYDTMNVLESCILTKGAEVFIKIDEYFDKGYWLVEKVENYEFGLHITYKLRKTNFVKNNKEE